MVVELVLVMAYVNGCNIFCSSSRPVADLLKIHFRQSHTKRVLLVYYMG